MKVPPSLEEIPISEFTCIGYRLLDKVWGEGEGEVNCASWRTSLDCLEIVGVAFSKQWYHSIPHSAYYSSLGGAGIRLS